MSHTPGPWEIDPRVSTRVRDGADTTIASAGVASRNYEDAQANARVIAAAPDMLAALEALLDFVWGEGYSDAAPELARAEALVRALKEAA